MVPYPLDRRQDSSDLPAMNFVWLMHRAQRYTYAFDVDH